MPDDGVSVARTQSAGYIVGLHRHMKQDEGCECGSLPRGETASR